MRYFLIVLIVLLHFGTEAKRQEEKPLSAEQLEIIHETMESLKKDAIELRIEADAICSVFSPENLEDVIASTDPIFKASQLQIRLEEAYKKTKTNTIQNVLESLSLVEPDKRYQSYRSTVSTFLGEEYDCEDLKSYLTL